MGLETAMHILVEPDELFPRNCDVRAFMATSYRNFMRMSREDGMAFSRRTVPSVHTV